MDVGRLPRALGIRASNKMKLKFNMGATACLQAVFFLQFQQHCLQASSGTRHFLGALNMFFGEKKKS
jgi:hypothetical protein